jgi:hypothetical protein
MGPESMKPRNIPEISETVEKINRFSFKLSSQVFWSSVHKEELLQLQI